MIDPRSGRPMAPGAFYLARLGRQRPATSPPTNEQNREYIAALLRERGYAVVHGRPMDEIDAELKRAGWKGKPT
ncbi:MAG TPA: hypothetical protein VNS09_16065 [Solirubrobacter sp.]|nr:hypothetical protein [Solirubrobacter sp.]